MSAFCVFGASMAVARARAEKKIPTREHGQLLSEAEWRRRVEAQASRIFERVTPVRISGEFDAPQFCEEFISLAARCGGKHVSRLKVMQIGEKLGAKGNLKINKRTGKAAIGWVPRHK